MEDNVFIASLATGGKEMGDCGKMCRDCAFVTGSDANNDDAAVQAAISCLMADMDFHCHTHDFKDAGRTCAGFQYAKQYLASPEFFKTIKINRSNEKLNRNNRQRMS